MLLQGLVSLGIPVVFIVCVGSLRIIEGKLLVGAMNGFPLETKTIFSQIRGKCGIYHEFPKSLHDDNAKNLSELFDSLSRDGSFTFCNCEKLFHGQEGVKSIYEQCFSTLIGRRSLLSSYWSNITSVADCKMHF